MKNEMINRIKRYTRLSKESTKDEYEEIVRFITKYTKRYLKEKPSKGYDLDHIYSISEGFNNKVDPLIISHFKNLRYIPSDENRAKNDLCDITLDELCKQISNVGVDCFRKIILQDDMKCVINKISRMYFKENKSIGYIYNELSLDEIHTTIFRLMIILGNERQTFCGVYGMDLGLKDRIPYENTTLYRDFIRYDEDLYNIIKNKTYGDGFDITTYILKNIEKYNIIKDKKDAYYNKFEFNSL